MNPFTERVVQQADNFELQLRRQLLINVKIRSFGHNMSYLRPMTLPPFKCSLNFCTNIDVLHTVLPSTPPSNVLLFYIMPHNDHQPF
jgi:hypothetical protein